MTAKTTGLVELKALAAEATPGPWLQEGRLIYALDENNEVNRFSVRIDGGVRVYWRRASDVERTANEELEANAKLIAAVPDMIDLLSTQETTIAELVAALEGSRRAMRDMIVGIGVHNDRAIDRHVPIEGPVISALIDAERQAETALTKSRSAL